MSEIERPDQPNPHVPGSQLPESTSGLSLETPSGAPGLSAAPSPVPPPPPPPPPPSSPSQYHQAAPAPAAVPPPAPPPSAPASSIVPPASSAPAPEAAPAEPEEQPAPAPQESAAPAAAIKLELDPASVKAEKPAPPPPQDALSKIKAMLGGKKAAPAASAAPAAKGSKQVVMLAGLLAVGAVVGGYFYLSAAEQDNWTPPARPRVAQPRTPALPQVNTALPPAAAPQAMQPVAQIPAPPNAQQLVSPSAVSAGTLPVAGPVATPAPAPAAGVAGASDAAAAMPTEQGDAEPSETDDVVKNANAAAPTAAGSAPQPADAAAVKANATPGAAASAADSATAAVPPVKTEDTAATGTSAAKDPAAAGAAPKVVEVEDAGEASSAEQAIVENSGVLEAMPEPTAKVAPKGKKVTDILSEPANVRPLPNQYVVVKKEKDAEDFDSRLTGARSALQQRRYSAALELFSDLYLEFPEDTRVLMGRAVAFQRLGRNTEALDSYEEVLNVDPKNVQALTNMLGILGTQEKDIAIKHLLQLKDMHPYNADIMAQLGMLYGTMGDYNNSVKYLDMADSLSPNNPNILFNKAVAYDKMGNVQQAADLYRMLIHMASYGDMEANLPLEQIKKRLADLR